MMDKEFTVGQQVFVVSNKDSEKSSFGIITKLGRKYIYVEKNHGERYSLEIIFDKETLREKTIYSPDYKLYYDEQEYKDENYIWLIKRRIKKMFYDFGQLKLSLELAQKFAELLDEMENEDEI